MTLTGGFATEPAAIGAQAAADKTFGLKNKKKSAKVQQYVNQVNSSVGKSASNDRKRAEAKKAKEAAAAAKAEMEAMFKSVKTKKQKEQERQQVVELTPEEKWKLAFDKLPDQEKVDTLLFGKEKIVTNRSLEDRVEECRLYIEKKTPVTATIFRDWLKKREEVKTAKKEAEKAERLKKGRLTGRELWPQIMGHIQDDEGAADLEEMARRAEEEEEELRKQDEMIAKLREKQKKGNKQLEEEYEDALKDMAEKHGMSVSTNRVPEGEEALDDDLAAEMEGLEDLEDLDGLEDALENAEI